MNATPMRIAVAGKGGAGKSVIAGTLARVLARRGERVLALDSDLMPGLGVSLGVGPLTDAMLTDAAEKDENDRWRLKRGIGPVRAVQRFALDAPDGVRLLQCGKLGSEGLPPIMGSVNAYYKVVHRIAREHALPDWTIVGDLPAGPRHVAFEWAPYAATFLLVVEPTWKSVLVARRVARIARNALGADVVAVGNKLSSEAGLEKLAGMLKEPLFHWVPADEAVGDADRAGAALIDYAPDSAALGAIEALALRLGQR